MPENEYGYDLDNDDTIDEIMYEWETLVDDRVYDTSRWYTYWEKVVKSPLGVPYLVTWMSGSTEYQECDPEYRMIRVKPIQETVTVYVLDKD